jgi:ketosteroid isomerase-like protein
MSRGARATAEQILHAGAIDTFREVTAPDGHRGHAEIHAHLTAVGESLTRFDEHRDVVIHETADPEIIIAEYAAHGTVVTTGAVFPQQVIAVLQVRVSGGGEDPR